MCLSVRVRVCQTLVCEPSTEVSTSSCVVLGRVLQLWESELPHPLMQGGGATHHPRECHWDDVIPTVIVGVVTVRQTCVKWLHHTLATGCTTLCDLHCVAWLSVPVATGHPVVCCNHTRSCSPNTYVCVCVVRGCEGCVLNKFLSTYIYKRFSSFMYNPLPSHPFPSHPVSCSPLPSHHLPTHPLPSHPLPSPPLLYRWMTMAMYPFTSLHGSTVSVPSVPTSTTSWSASAAVPSSRPMGIACGGGRDGSSG